MLRICNPKRYELGICNAPKSFRVTNPYTRFAADNISAASQGTAWDAICLCHQNISAASQKGALKIGCTSLHHKTVKEKNS